MSWQRLHRSSWGRQLRVHRWCMCAVFLTLCEKRSWTNYCARRTRSISVKLDPDRELATAMKPQRDLKLNIVALAGGVGGARLADGLTQIQPSHSLTVIVNTGDDFEHLGLTICPDLDTVCYTLAGIANPVTGWGRSGETFQALETTGDLGGATWFRVGDKDLGLHLERTRRKKSGQSLSQITQHICKSFGIQATILPMSDDSTPTWVYTKEGILPFQDYFVRRQCQPQVTGFRFEGAEKAKPAPGALQAIQTADIVVICPSNPWVSIDPILAIPGVRAALEKKKSLPYRQLSVG